VPKQQPPKPPKQNLKTPETLKNTTVTSTTAARNGATSGVHVFVRTELEKLFFWRGEILASQMIDCCRTNSTRSLRHQHHGGTTRRMQHCEKQVFAEYLN
jgi:hypothetical protein